MHHLKKNDYILLPGYSIIWLNLKWVIVLFSKAFANIDDTIITLVYVVIHENLLLLVLAGFEVVLWVYTQEVS